MVESIGADRVIDYTREDFTRTKQRHDLMLDLVGNRSLSECRPALAPTGTYVLVGVSDMGRWLGDDRQMKAFLLSPFVRQRMRVFVVRHNRDDLAVLKDPVEAGKLAPVIDSRWERPRRAARISTDDPHGDPCSRCGALRCPPAAEQLALLGPLDQPRPAARSPPPQSNLRGSGRFSRRPSSASRSEHPWPA